MVSATIVNASPIIFLSRGRHLELLRGPGSVLVPEPVAAEIAHKGESDITVQALRKADWLEIVPSVSVPTIVQEWGLGRGESAVLALALERAPAEVVIDDLAARRCAESLGVAVRGTLGIVLLAKRRGEIPSARSVMEDLIAGGMYLSPGVLNAALAHVGE